MEIDRRTFCRLFIFSSVSFIAGCFRPSHPGIQTDKITLLSESGYPGKVIPLDRTAMRKMGRWAG